MWLIKHGYISTSLESLYEVGDLYSNWSYKHAALVRTSGPGRPVMLNSQWSKRVCQADKLAGDKRPPVCRCISVRVGRVREGHSLATGRAHPVGRDAAAHMSHPRWGLRYADRRMLRRSVPEYSGVEFVTYICNWNIGIWYIDIRLSVLPKLSNYIIGNFFSNNVDYSFRYYIYYLKRITKLSVRR